MPVRFTGDDVDDMLHTHPRLRLRFPLDSHVYTKSRGYVLNRNLYDDIQFDRDENDLPIEIVELEVFAGVADPKGIVRAALDGTVTLPSFESLIQTASQFAVFAASMSQAVQAAAPAKLDLLRRAARAKTAASAAAAAAGGRRRVR